MKPRLAVLTYINIGRPKIIKYIVALLFTCYVSTKSHISKTGLPLLLLILMIEPATFSTSIVFVRRKAELVVAADGQQVLISGDNGSGRFSPTCKIGQIGHVFFAFAGNVNDNFGYDSFKIAANACNPNRTVLDTLKQFETLIEVSLSGSFAKMNRQKLGGIRALEAAFFGIEDGLARLHIRYWQGESASKDKVPIKLV